jgi:pimeloyl-ACP methyl ester carboxylesterase
VPVLDDADEDRHTLSEIARSNHLGLPLVLVGHSMGGLLSGRYAQTWPDEVAGVAFRGAVIGDWQWARDVPAEPELPSVAFDPDAISRDPAAGPPTRQTRLYITVSTRGRCSFRRWTLSMRLRSTLVV